jgi:hypothetical protein
LLLKAKIFGGFAGRNRFMTVPVADITQDQPNPWAGAVGLVFLGFEVAWSRRVSDYALNTEFADKWERDFSQWQISDRRFELSNKNIGYFVSLLDGKAHFRCESVVAYNKALEHVTELLGKLITRQQEKTIAQFQAQFLLASEKSFAQHQDYLRPKLLQESFHEAIGANIVDFAYLADCFIDGSWYQINAGPVRAKEIPQRVAALTLKGLPQVATFLSVTSRQPFEYEVRDLSAAALQTVKVGNNIAHELAL